MKKESTNFITHIRNVVSVNWGKEKIALNLSHAYATWMKEIIETMVDNCIEQKPWQMGMIVVIFMLQS